MLWSDRDWPKYDLVMGRQKREVKMNKAEKHFIYSRVPSPANCRTLEWNS